MKTDIMNNVTRTFHKGLFQIKKHSPEILLTTGLVGVVATTVVACKATTKASAILEETKSRIDTIHEVANNPEMAEDYTAEDYKKDLAIVYTQTALEYGKLYGPSIALGLASIGCILASHSIIHKRNVALSAAFTSVSTSFKEYSDRVIERFGKELDHELRYNIKAKEIEETVVNEDGTEATIKKTVNAADPNVYSEYARFFDEYCSGWTKDPERNLYFLKQQQNWANERLKARGYLFLNEVYDMLGIPRTKAGQVVGWVYDEENGCGDNFVDFGIYDLYNEKARNFVNGLERSILLDFNVDGVIWELLN